MLRRLWLIPLFLFAVPPAIRAQGAAPIDRGKAADEKAIREIEAQWEAAWNRHDVAAMARNYAPDSDAINLAGEWFKGRAAFVKSLESPTAAPCCRGTLSSRASR
jgi:ketosteroid isomerase-like protein